MTDNTKRVPFAVLIQAVRAPFFTASAIPVLLAAIYALWHKVPVAWPLLPITVFGIAFLQAGTNCINDYYDFKKGVDKKETFGSSRVLVDGLMAPEKIRMESYILFALGAAMGILVMAWRGPVIAGIGLLGLAAGYFYSAKPLGLKYHALGDVMVFLFFGPLLAWGSFFALTGTYSTDILLVSLPVGFLVTAIVHANNTRDTRDDKAAGIKTLAMLLGLEGAKAEYCLLVVGAYMAILVMIVTKVLPWHAALVILSVPFAASNMKTIAAVKEDDLRSIATMDVQTAQLHLVFGLLLTLSIGLAVVFP